jgi:hypothetical protein
MGNCAVVVGVDAYANPKWNLDSATRDALAFASWAVKYGKVDVADLSLLLSPVATIPNPVPLPDNAGVVKFSAATSSAVLTGVRNLAKATGERAFIYFAGHGCSAPGTKWEEFPEPVLIPSDAGDLSDDYKLLLGYSELQHPLLESGPTEQFFFFDACRDFLLENHERGIGSAVGPGRGKGERRIQFLLHSTSPGEQATEKGVGIFGEALLEGLKGFSALLFNPRLNEYELTFKSLTDFVVEEVSRRIDRIIPQGSAKFVQKPQAVPSKGKLDTVIVSYSPANVDPYPVKVRVDPRLARPESRIEVYYYTPAGETKIKDACIGPPLDMPAVVQLRPGDYSLRVEPQTYDSWRKSITVPKTRELDVDLGQAKIPSPQPIASALPDAIRFRSDDWNIPIVVYRPDSEVPVVGVHEVTINNPVIGIYRAQLILPEGAGAPLLVDVPKDMPTGDGFFRLLPPRPPMNAEQLSALISVGMTAPGETYVQPSELIGPTADVKVASLLAFAAYAAYSFKRQDYMNKLRSFGVTPVPPLRPDSGWMTLLLGCSGKQPVGNMAPKDFLSGSVVSVLSYMEEVHGRGVLKPLSGFPAAAEFGCECPSGPKFVELRIPGFADTRYATIVMSGRASVLVVVANDDGTVDVQQYLLPLDAEPGKLDPPDMRTVEMAQRFYTSTDRVPDHVIDRLLDAKFVDPILGCLAGYLLIRQKQAERYIGVPGGGATPNQIEPSPMRNMLKFFGSIPDSHILAALAQPDHREEHFANAAKLGLPLFTEGFSALFNAKNVEFKPFFRSIGHSLLTGSPWTAWTAREPVIDFTETKVQRIPENWRILENYRPQIEALAPSVGAVLKTDGKTSVIIGTAFLIGEGRAITSIRVAEEITEGGSLLIKPGLSVVIDFGVTPSTGGSQVRVSQVRAVPQGHLSVLTLENAPSAAGRLCLADAPDSARVLDNVYLIGYPIADSRNDPEVVVRTIRSGRAAKRLQPGIILEISDDGTAIDHSCFTLTGSGGSPLVHLESGRAIGVHWGGWKKSYGRGRATVLHGSSKWL